MAIEVRMIQKEELRDRLGAPNTIILDLRTNWEAERLKIKGAVHEDPDHANAWIHKYGKDQKLILYCGTPNEKTSSEAARELLRQGYADVQVLKGGWKVWLDNHYPVEEKTAPPRPKGVIRDISSD